MRNNSSPVNEKPSGTGRKGNKLLHSVTKRLFTLKEAAQYLGRSEWSMRELIWSGAIPVVRPEGGRKIFIDVEDLNDFIARNKTIYS